MVEHQFQTILPVAAVNEHLAEEWLIKIHTTT